MSSQMFCELAALDTAELAKCGGDGGTVHRVTASVVDSRICSFANDAPAGCWVVLQYQPVGAVLPQAEVLLVAVQADKILSVGSVDRDSSTRDPLPIIQLGQGGPTSKGTPPLRCP